MPYRPASCWTCGKDLPLDHYWSSVGVSVGLACCSRECFESYEPAWNAERFERQDKKGENVTQDLMRLAALGQAHERSKREGVACFVYRRVNHPSAGEVAWYVRTEAEGIPEEGILEYIAKPGRHTDLCNATNDASAIERCVCEGSE